MQITALLQVINYLKEMSGNAVLLDKYNKLAEVLREASKDQQTDYSARIIKEKEQLRTFSHESDPASWGYASYSLFEKFNRNQLFGKSAADYLGNLDVTANKDYKSIYNDLSRKVKEIAKMSDSLSRFQQLYDEIVPGEFIQSVDKNADRPAMYLFFEGHLSVQNIADLERYARLWDGILGTFSRLNGEGNLSLDINSFRSGKVVLGVTIEETTLNQIITGVVDILTPLPLILKIRKIQLEIAHLPLYNDLNKLLDEEIKILIDQKARESASGLVSTKSGETTDTDALSDDLTRSLKQVLSFIERGGKIEFKLPIPTKELSGTNKLLIESFRLAAELEYTTDLLNQASCEKVNC